MNALINFSLKQKVFFNLIFVILIVLGSYALVNLPSDRFPSINFGEVLVSTYFPGASPAEVETLVTHEIEDALEAVAEIEWIKSSSFRERSRIRLKFTDDSDYDAIYNEVRFKILNHLDELPEEIDPPEINILKTQDYLPVVVVNLTGKAENRALTLMAKELKTPLRQVPGVQEIKIIGEYQREFHVYLDPTKLRALGISFDEVAAALQNTNISIPAGDFKDQSGEFIVKVDEKYRSRDEVLSTLVRINADGSFVRVADLISHPHQF